MEIPAAQKDVGSHHLLRHIRQMADHDLLGGFPLGVLGGFFEGNDDGAGFSDIEDHVVLAHHDALEFVPLEAVGLFGGFVDEFGFGDGDGMGADNILLAFFQAHARVGVGHDAAVPGDKKAHQEHGTGDDRLFPAEGLPFHELVHDEQDREKKNHRNNNAVDAIKIRGMLTMISLELQPIVLGVIKMEFLLFSTGHALLLLPLPYSPANLQCILFSHRNP